MFSGETQTQMAKVIKRTFNLDDNKQIFTGHPEGVKREDL